MQVMVVDDDVVSRIALKDLMGRAGFSDIVDFEDGQAAWEYLQTGPMPVLCCCDVRMPKMTGIEFLQHIRKNKRLAPMPFILITSGSERDVVNKAIVLGVGGYIVKPFNRNAATQKLIEVFDGAYKSIAEKPDATALRLAIPSEKLIEYYEAFMAQVDDLIKYVKMSPSVEFSDTITAQFTDINKGCLTLGLWHCSKQLDRLQALECDQETTIQYLKPLISAIKYQLSKIHLP